MRVIRVLFIFAVALGIAAAQDSDPYNALRLKDYDRAIAQFREAIVASPGRAGLHKDLAYTLLKTGQNEAARDEFAEAMRLDAADQQVALEYAFLCYETKRQAEARRIFDRIRKNGNATAEQAFQNIDRPLAEGIARWSKALEATPDNFSAHEELARLAEERDELPLAAEHYEKAWRLKPGERRLMLDLGRVWKSMGRADDANAILLAASRGGPMRVAEEAHELIGSRYPYVYEFEKALSLDAQNIELRREYAFLLLAMDHKDLAERQLETVHHEAPDDLVSAAQLGFLRWKRGDSAGAQPLFDQVLKGDDPELAAKVREALKLPGTLQQRGNSEPVSGSAKEMAEKSLKANYVQDALKYLKLANEEDPLDFEVMIKLAWVYNMMHQDSEAVKWFNLARKSPDPAIASEADKAYHNLEPDFETVRTTAWFYPFYSSRWHDAFGYGQVKTEFKLGSLPIRPYVSARFVGDARGAMNSTVSGVQPQYLSESSFIFALGLATVPTHGMTAWFEAGEAVKYLTSRTDVGAAIPDYRGGVSYAKGFGHLLTGGKGLFFETNDDAVFISRFQNDMLFYSQNRSGYTFDRSEAFGGFQAQVYWNFYGTTDRLRLYWANFGETGPGLRFRFARLPKSMLFSVNVFRGAYSVNLDNPRRPNFFDLQVGIWYAFTH